MDPETSCTTYTIPHNARRVRHSHIALSSASADLEPISRPVSPVEELENFVAHRNNYHSKSTTPPWSQSQSPQAGDKRRRGTSTLSSDGPGDDDEITTEVFDETEVFVVKAQKISKNAGRPKAADYEETARDIILAAANTYRALLASHGAFPDSSKESALIKKAWKLVNAESGMKPMVLSPDIVRIVSGLNSLFNLTKFLSSSRREDRKFVARPNRRLAP
jgi:hypothetical protein